MGGSWAARWLNAWGGSWGFAPTTSSDKYAYIYFRRRRR